jgi:hypothetical protein
MTDVTDLGEIVVVGQRRRPGESFPSGGGSGGGGSTGGPQQNELGEVQPEDPPTTPNPCDNPETALEWNADAAAAEALRRMQADANDPLLDGRERSFAIYRDPLTGQIRLGNLAVGPNMGGEVTTDLTGINRGDVIGVIHSHPGSGPYPSGPDRTNFTDFWQSEIGVNGGDPSLFRIYIVGTRADPGGAARIQIRVYNQDNLDGDAANPGPEVNQDAEFCPD